MVHALVDACPHRLAPLSLGKFEGPIVQCGYHGLAFDGTTGQCVRNPHGAVTGNMAVRSYPVVERHKLVWLWMGDLAAAEPATIPDLSFIDAAPVHAVSKGYMFAAADHRLLEDNILDLTHADYLHPNTLGGGTTTGATVTVTDDGNDTVCVRWDSHGQPAIPVWRPQLPTPDTLVDMMLEVHWRASGVMVLRGRAQPVDSPAQAIDTWNAHIITPMTETSSHYHYCNTRNYRMEDADYNAMLTEGLGVAFSKEDKPMIEAQQRRIGNRDLLDCEPRLLKIDNASIRARRMYNRLVEAEAVASMTL